MRRTALSSIMSLTLIVGSIGCDKKDDKGSKSSYDFSASAAATISSSKLAATESARPSAGLIQTAGPKFLCTSTQPNLTCVAPSALTGKYFSVGLLIQANGSGMLSYLLGDEWSSITGTSETFDFDAANPITVSGSFKCCGGEGDLTGENVYFSDVAYLFGYLDATFEIPFSAAQQATVSPAMIAPHTVRYVFADDVLTGYVRGDLLYKDVDGSFKWMDQEGALSSTRPSAPITMDDQVVSGAPSFSDAKTPVPPISTSLQTATGEGVIQTSEDELKTEGRTYSFDFDTTYAVALMVGQSDLSLLQTTKDLMERLHFQGLPSSEFTFGSSGTSTLSVD